MKLQFLFKNRNLLNLRISFWQNTEHIQDALLTLAWQAVRPPDKTGSYKYAT
jgi:hypothetical protein